MSDIYPLRDRIRYMLPYWIRQVWQTICEFFRPRQKWLTSKIPNGWRDKDTIFEICLIEGIKHFVEGEGGLDHFESSQRNPDYPEWQRTFDRELKEAYELVTKELPRLEKEMEKEWAKIPPITPDNLLQRLNYPTIPYDEMYGKIDKLEKDISALKTKVMVWAVVSRESMWT